MKGSNFHSSIGEVPSTADRFYYLKDHLGSIKMMVNGSGEVKSYDDYYPFGMIPIDQGFPQGFNDGRKKLSNYRAKI